MIHVANLSETDRRALFLNTAEKKNLHPAVVEKDFWVCYLLDHLFHRNQYQKSFVFKGGTSLSILHKIAHFPESKKLPPRYARHYYDLYMMYHSSVKDDAFKRKELLLKDIAFKSKFYYSKSASYETATLSGIKLAPPERLISEISMDYDRMKNMIYGEKPDFEIILRDVSLLEDEIHNLVESDI